MIDRLLGQLMSRANDHELCLPIIHFQFAACHPSLDIFDAVRYSIRSCILVVNMSWLEREIQLTVVRVCMSFN